MGSKGILTIYINYDDMFESINSSVKNKVIGIDVGVETTEIAVVDLRGEILGQVGLCTTDYPNVTNFVEALSEEIIKLAEANGGYESLRSAGVGMPSGNYLTGCIENAGNLPWKGIVPLAAMLRDRIGMAVALGNDVHVAALGEHVYGTAHGMQNFGVVMANSAGLGSCFFINGKAYLGTSGSAGELGHCCVEDNGRLCNCGRRGCLEAYVSSKGIRLTAEELMAESSEPSLMRQAEKLTYTTVCDFCQQGDALALETMRRTGEVFGRALANYATLLNPEAIVLTGPLTICMPWMTDKLQESFHEHVFHNIRNKVKLVVSSLDNHERGMLGAAALAWSVQEYSLFK